MKLRAKIWLLSSAIVLTIMAVDMFIGWRGIEAGIRTELESQAKDIRGMLMATRRIYHRQFLNSGLPVNDQTVGFLPAHALSRISQDFPNWSRSGMSFNNVSDRPRNPANLADQDELAAMAWFRAHPKDAEHLTEIRGPEGKPYYHYTAPIWVEKYCLACHGDRGKAPPSIAKSYDSAYGYQVGDLRGVMSIKLPAGPLREREYGAWLHEFSYRLAGYVALLLALGVFLNRVVLARVARLEAAAGRMAQGDYGARLPPDAQDELGSLCLAFNRMAQSVQDHEAALAASEERFRTATESMRDAFVLIEGEKGLVRGWNRAAEAMFGVGRADILGRPLPERLLCEPERLAMERALASFARSGTGPIVGKTLEISAWHRDGHSFPVELSVSSMTIGGRWLAVGVVRDISERKATEEGRQRQLASLKALNEIGAIPDLDLVERLRRALAIGCRLFGLEYGIVSHIAGQEYRLVSQHAPDGALEDGQIFDLGNTYCSVTVQSDGVLAVPDVAHSPYMGHPCYRMYRLESYLGVPVRVGGQPFGTVNFSSPAAYPRAFDEGDREFMELLGRWVSLALEQDQARQKLESLVAQRTSELNSLFLAIPDLYFRMSAEGGILDYRCGKASELYLPPESFLGRRMQDVLPPAVGEQFRQAFVRLGETGGETIEYRLAVPEGEHYFEARILPLGAGQMVAVVRNITERRTLEAARERALEEAERLARLRSEFLANMSHEIRTPLNGVLGLAQVGWRNAEPNSKARDTFGRIVDSGKVLMGVVNDILDFSRIEAGKLAVEQVPVNLELLLREAVALVAEKARAKGLALTQQLDASLPAGCLGDPVRLAQVLGNLLANAVKFTEHGEVSVAARLEGERFILRVQDTGIGMSSEQVGRLFQPFEQADGSTTRKFGGTGLGLAICHRLVELMGGGIAVSSVPGAGSRFEVRLPYLPLPGRQEFPRVEPREPAEPGARLKGYVLLVAEDNDVNQMVIRDMLEEEGAKVVVAGDGRAALESFLADGTAAYDLVLMDVQMPVMDGLEATRAILAARPGTRVVGQTAHAMVEEREKCLAAGMVDVVVKPIAQDELVAAVLRNVPGRGKTD